MKIFGKIAKRPLKKVVNAGIEPRLDFWPSGIVKCVRFKSLNKVFFYAQFVKSLLAFRNYNQAILVRQTNRGPKMRLTNIDISTCCM